MLGKNNYSTETCYRMDTLYGPHIMQPEELEWKRQNQLVVMTDGGHAISYTAAAMRTTWEIE